MAIMTRTQKYAALREELANDTEAKTVNEDLSKYNDRLKDFEDSFNKDIDEVLRMHKDVSESRPAPVHEEPVKEIRPVDARKEQLYDFLSQLDTDNLEKDIDVILDKNEKKEETPAVVRETPAPAPVVETPAKEENVEDILDSIIREADSVTEANTVKAPEPEPVRPVETVNTAYVNNILNEVDDYNRNDGRKTLDELSEAMVNAVRHPDENEKPEEFSNTVTLEIDKVLTEIDKETAAEVKTAEPAVETEPVKEEKVEEAPPVTEATVEVKKDESDTLEHPVLTKQLEEDKPVEILPMNETLKMDVIDDTIPFVTDAKEETEEVVEAEDSGFNKVINFILIALIVVLIAILGVIVYYILYAKGIIG